LKFCLGSSEVVPVQTDEASKLWWTTLWPTDSYHFNAAKT